MNKSRDDKMHFAVISQTQKNHLPPEQPELEKLF